MLGTMRVVWRLSREAEVTILDANLFLFKFAIKKDKARIKEGFPWSFDKHLLVFKDYDGDLRPSDYRFDKASFWVRVYGLTLRMMTRGIAERIGNKLGTLIADSSG
ncbi:hypothetical protein CRYUN_Cryun28dG0003000 [Craigia yunnanensis]